MFIIKRIKYYSYLQDILYINNLSNFDTNNVINMSYMFCKCLSLKEINLSSFNTNNVEDMSYMFSECTLLNKLNLSSFNTNNVKDMSCMLHNCKSLKDLDLSSFETNDEQKKYNIFSGCPKKFLNKIENQYGYLFANRKFTRYYC